MASAPPAPLRTPGAGFCSPLNDGVAIAPQGAGVFPARDVPSLLPIGILLSG